ncbi:MAG: rhamnulose-1-phosphate aldolase/alcohol dehydrogenase [Anaerolineales bacterium]|nr:rhamnulose-1-phosphate aldolase/alcohol dehydrogenase [Anaerolineales bacterium]
MPKNLWNASEASQLAGLDLLVYRSHLLGADRSVCNIFGGNTGTKTVERDFRGREVKTLWVKGSGSDLATMQRKDFAGLRLDDVLPLFEREAMTDEEMTAYLTQCLIGLNMPRQSIETLLHAFIPAAHTDHTHPDAVISLACSTDGEQWARKLYGGRMAWVPYIRPGFTLSQWIGQAVREHPKIECVIMGKHGLVTWDDDPRACYAKTIRIIQEAEDFIAEQPGGRTAFAVTRTPPLSAERRREIAAQILPVLRGAASVAGRMVTRFDDGPGVLDFIGADAPAASAVAAVGAACPDHLVHTKRIPLFIDWDAASGDVETLKTKLRAGVTAYIADYERYFKEHSGPSDKMGNPAPRVVLIPGLGMITTGKDATLAQVSADLYHRAITVMRGATALDRFVSLTEAESFAIEYWPLELYKLTLRPPDRELAGRIAFITGGASGIGRATALRLAAEGAHVVIADLNASGAETVASEIVKKHGAKRGLAVGCDVTNEEQVAEAFRQTVLNYGGVDIVVSNAGLAASAPVTETSRADWDRIFNVLATGYFLVSREAFKVWGAQKSGGSLVFVASKNGLIGSKNAAAYNAAKAAEIHLARSLAEEGGALGVRVNVVNPDAVVQGSGIWDAGWREARAKGMGVPPDQLEEAYRQRTTLKTNVYAEDVAEAILFFASDRSAKTTGGILNVDGGLVAAYVR